MCVLSIMEALKALKPEKEEQKAFFSAIGLVVLALILEIIIFIVLEDSSSIRTRGWVIILFGIVTPIVGLYFWYRYLPRFAPPVMKFLIENIFGRKLVGGGSFAYYEYKPPEEAESILKPIFRLINILIAYLGLTVTIAKIIFNFVEFNPKAPLDSWGATIIWLVFMFLIPILLTPIIPITWGFEDNKLKIWSKGNKTNWMLSDRYKMRFNSFVSIAAVTAGMAFGDESLIDTITLFLRIVLSAFLILILPNAILLLGYYLIFRKELKKMIRESVSLPTYETTLIEREAAIESETETEPSIAAESDESQEILSEEPSEAINEVVEEEEEGVSQEKPEEQQEERESEEESSEESPTEPTA